MDRSVEESNLHGDLVFSFSPHICGMVKVAVSCVQQLTMLTVNILETFTVFRFVSNFTLALLAIVSYERIVVCPLN